MGPRALLLVSGSCERIHAWGRGGLVSVEMAALDDWWTGIVALSSAAVAPYDDPATVLLNTALPYRMRPAIGFMTWGDQALITVHPKRFRAPRQWVIWRSGQGIVPPGPLSAASLRAVLAAADRPDTSRARALADALRESSGSPAELIVELLEVLELPGSGFFAGRSLAQVGQAEPVLIEPDADKVARFNEMVAEEAEHLSELDRSHTARPLGEETAREHHREQESRRRSRRRSDPNH